MPKHSIIIPHHDRELHLAVCLGSLAAALGDADDYEILIVGTLAGALRKALAMELPKARVIDVPPHAAVELGENEPPPFHKTKLLNIGLDQAQGEILTFLDADAVVGPKFAENLARLTDDTLAKLCYRVRYAPYTAWQNADATWSWAFAHYNGLSGLGLAFEAYGNEPIDADQDYSQVLNRSDSNVAAVRTVYGNSQFSIRRDKLGDLRWDERYFGRGWEDIAFNRSLAERHGDAYRAEIVTDGPHALFHIRHTHTPGYESGRWNERNRRLYYQEPLDWFICHDLETAEQITAQHPKAEAIWPPNDRWRLSEVIPGLDTVVRLEGVAAA